MAVLQQRCSRTGLVLVVLLLLAARAMVPAGFMPAADADGWITLQLCTTQGLEQRLVRVNPLGTASDPTGSEPAPHTERTDCAYALTPGASPAAEAPRLPHFVSIAALVVAADTASAAAGPLARSQSARGPPASIG